MATPTVEDYDRLRKAHAELEAAYGRSLALIWAKVAIVLGFFGTVVAIVYFTTTGDF